MNIRGNPAMNFWPWHSDVFHASNHLVNPPTRRVRLTATIYDLTCWLIPEMHQELNVFATKRYAERVLQRADACIAISERTRQDAIDILHIPAERITTIYPGVPEAFFNPPPPEAVTRQHSLHKPYLLYVGTVEPRKRVDTIIDAYRRLPPSVQAHCDLVVVGMLGWCDAATRRALLEPDLPGIRYLGYVPEADLPALTRGAAAVVFPSVYEGFGFPVAQGMAAGAPVITSRGSSLEEIAGGACLLVTPGAVDELCDAMQRVLESSSLQQELIRKGRTQAELFHWEFSARQTMDFFQSVKGLSS
jgi:alpha-1,3-rhamnosyl/mannosyltransferase